MPELSPLLIPADDIKSLQISSVHFVWDFILWTIISIITGYIKRKVWQRIETGEVLFFITILCVNFIWLVWLFSLLICNTDLSMTAVVIFVYKFSGTSIFCDICVQVFWGKYILRLRSTEDMPKYIRLSPRMLSSPILSLM